MCVALNEGYLRAANRGSNNLIVIPNQNMKRKNISALNEKNIFWSVFYFF